jgi:DNA polymerase-3 subunit delta'
LGGDCMRFGDWEHEPAVRQLRQDVQSGQPAHAYLLAGPATRCKQEAANTFAQALLCLATERGEPCGACDSCHAWKQQAHPDYHFLEPEGSSLKIEQIRQWQPFFSYHPQLGRHQVFFLSAPELLTEPAANSLLKVLEEPLPQTVFLLATEDERALLPTLASRCRVVLFRAGCRAQRAPGAEPGAEPGQDLPVEDGDKATASLRQLLWGGSEAELMRQVRLIKLDRPAAGRLLRSLLSDLEQFYRKARNQVMVGQGNAGISRGLLECLDVILTGQQLLEGNVSVPLLLALTLRALQKRLREIPLEFKDDGMHEQSPKIPDCE